MRLMEKALIVVSGTLFFIAGCCSEPKLQHAEKICTSADKKTAFKAAQRVLENMKFTIEKADLEAGYISTRPLPAKQFFELWKSDTVGCYNFEEANLQSITRTAEITITDGPQTCINCMVTTHRLSLPEAEVTNTTEPFGLFAKSNSGTQSMRLARGVEKEAKWVNLGPDYKLEARILERIADRISEKTAALAPTSAPGPSSK